MVLYLRQHPVRLLTRSYTPNTTQLLERTKPALWAKLVGIMREQGPAGPLTQVEVAARAAAEAEAAAEAKAEADGTAEDRGAADAAADAAAEAEAAAERAGLNVRCMEV